MSSAYAYFIRWRGGNYEAVPVHEHEVNARSEPARYGLDKKFIKEVDKQFRDLNDRRREILLQVMRNGWMRVRDHGPNKGTTFEFVSMGDATKAIEAVTKFGQSQNFQPLQWLRLTDLYTKSPRTKEMSWKAFKAARGNEEKLLGSKLEKDEDDEGLFGGPEAHTLPPTLKPQNTKRIWEPTGSPIYRAAKVIQKNTGVEWAAALHRARQAYGQQEAMESGEMTIVERVERVGREAARIAHQPISEGCAEDEISVLQAMGVSMRYVWRELRGHNASVAASIATEIQETINAVKNGAKPSLVTCSLSKIASHALSLVESLEPRSTV